MYYSNQLKCTTTPQFCFGYKCRFQSYYTAHIRLCCNKMGNGTAGVMGIIKKTFIQYEFTWCRLSWFHYMFPLSAESRTEIPPTSHLLEMVSVHLSNIQRWYQSHRNRSGIQWIAPRPTIAFVSSGGESFHAGSHFRFRFYSIREREKGCCNCVGTETTRMGRIKPTVFHSNTVN